VEWIGVECAELLLRLRADVDEAVEQRTHCGSTTLLHFLYTSFRLVQLVKHNRELKVHLR